SCAKQYPLEKDTLLHMPTIMIVDDDAAIRQVLRDLLEDEGFSVTEAEAGSAVIEAFESDAGKPDLVMMDVRMPDKSGIDVLKEIKHTDDGPLPIIMMTAFGTSSIAIQAMQAGAYDYLTKPFDLDDVMLTIRRLFDRKQLYDQIEE